LINGGGVGVVFWHTEERAAAIMYMYGVMALVFVYTVMKIAVNNSR
jgi:hypothetical protein